MRYNLAHFRGIRCQQPETTAPHTTNPPEDAPLVKRFLSIASAYAEPWLLRSLGGLDVTDGFSIQMIEQSLGQGCFT
jgi:hypothetical protein